MADYVELFKTVGALVGFLGGLFIFYDRFNRGRPVASLTFSEDGSRNIAIVRVTNPTDYDVMIIDTVVKPKLYFLTESLETRDLIEGQTSGVHFILKPKQSRELTIAPLYKDGVAVEMIKPGRVNFWIYWRRGNATWMKMLPVPVCTSTDILRRFALDKN